MIELKTNDGHCELSLNGTGAELATDTGVIIHAVYNALMKSVPDFMQAAYGNFYRVAVLKAITDCKPVDYDSSYPLDNDEP